jgi:hypothetical protein
LSAKLSELLVQNGPVGIVIAAARPSNSAVPPRDRVNPLFSEGAPRVKNFESIATKRPSTIVKISF